MKLFAPVLACVDLETTGMNAASEAITEVGVVRVVADPEGILPPQLRTWSTLVDPQRSIPPAIQALTGITNAMVRGAPTFAEVAGEIEAQTADAVFVAHNARFDYGFLKHAFARTGRNFRRPVLCTVKLSRRMHPDVEGHSLDHLIARHGLQVEARHRAQGDAQIVWDFLAMLYREHDADAIAAAAKRILRIPSLPPQLPPDALDHIPERPGVYRFYGENALPLYIGKAKDLRERIGAHFSSDYRSSTDSRLSAEIRRIEFEVTVGEIGALLRESALVKSMLPSHNHRLRRKAGAGVLELADPPGPPRFVVATEILHDGIAGRYGPFSSRRAAREALRSAAATHGLCLVALGLERRSGPCFARQIRRCAGLCVGAESAAAHDARLRAALAPHLIASWAWPGPAAIREVDAANERTDLHVVDHWSWIGTARDESELAQIMAERPRPAFDLDITRMLLRHGAKRGHEWIALPAFGGER